MYHKIQGFAKNLKKLSKEINKKIKLKRVHGDFNPGNIMIEGNKAKELIDWEFSGLGSIYQDVSQFANIEDEFSNKFLEDYFSKSPENYDQQLYDFFKKYFLLKIVSNYFTYKNFTNINNDKEELIYKKIETITDYMDAK